MPKRPKTNYTWERLGIGHYKIRGFNVEVVRIVADPHLGSPRVVTWQVRQGNHIVGTTYAFADASAVVEEYLAGLFT